MVDFKKDEFDKQILNRLNNRNLSEGYTFMTEQQLDDIITCAASVFIRGSFSMNYKFTDLNKDANFLGFESGVSCFYPNYIDKVFLSNSFKCVESEFFLENYNKTGKYKTIPTWFDPRCRPWYKK